MSIKKEHFNPDTYIVIDRITGEEIPVSIFFEDITSDYWEKAFAKTLAEYIGVGGSSADCKVLAYFIKNKKSDNLIHGTVREIAKNAGVSPPTVSKVFKLLKDKEFIKKIRSGCYFLSPKIMRHGSKTRGAMLLRLWDGK